MKKCALPQINRMMVVPRQLMSCRQPTAKLTTANRVNVNNIASTIKREKNQSIHVNTYIPPKLEWRPFLSSSSERCQSSQHSQKSNHNSDENNTERDDDVHAVLNSALTFFFLLYAVEEFYSITTCVGPSMLPTFREDGDVVIIQKLDHSKTLLGRLFFNNEDDKQATTIDMPKQTPRWHRHVYKKGDAVIACCKDDVNKTVCKRIAGIEGDLMSFRGNGIMPRMVRVPQGHVWLLGDNPSNSKDSRSYGPVPLCLIQGKILCKVNLPSGLLFGDQKTIEWVEHTYPLPKARQHKHRKTELKSEVEEKGSTDRQVWLKRRKEEFKSSSNNDSRSSSGSSSTDSSNSSSSDRLSIDEAKKKDDTNTPGGIENMKDETTHVVSVSISPGDKSGSSGKDGSRPPVAEHQQQQEQQQQPPPSSGFLLKIPSPPVVVPRKRGKNE